MKTKKRFNIGGKIFTIEDVEKVYTGKDHHCRCGCAGNYYYSSLSRQVNVLLTNDVQVQSLITRATNLIGKGAGHITDIKEGLYINVRYGNNRAITIYFREKK